MNKTPRRMRPTKVERTVKHVLSVVEGKVHPPTLIRAMLFVLPLILALPAIQPFLRNELTRGYDNVLHLWRAFEADQMLSHGILYTRWYPHMVFGLGYPMLLFNPPLSPLLAALLHRLGLGWPAAINGIFALGTLLSGWTVWLLIRDDPWRANYGWRAVETQDFASLPDTAALAAAAAMVTIPFHIYVNVHRASMSEALAWAFPGLILWGLLHWQRPHSSCHPELVEGSPRPNLLPSGRRERLGLLAATLGLALMLLTHDAFTYLFLPMLGLLVVALALGYRSWRVLWRGILAIVLGLGLAAFFWIPSVVERGYVQFDRVLRYNYAASFVPLDYLLEPPRAADTSLINPWPPKGIGVLPVLVIGASVLAAAAVRWQLSPSAAMGNGVILSVQRRIQQVRRIRQVRREVRARYFWWGAMLITTVGYLWIASPAAAWVWELVSPLAYLHFPWRFLAPATVGVAALVGVSVGWLARSGPRWRYVPYGIIALLILGSLGWLYPRFMSLSYPVSLPGMMAYEHETQWLGGTTFGELLPRWVEALPQENPVAADLSAGRTPVRLRPEDLPEGATILEATYGPNRADLEIETPVAFRARYWAFYYPGWRVWIDGKPVAVTPEGDDADAASTGLITFEVPSGRHTIAVRFGETPLRLAADAVSLFSLIVLGIVLLYKSPSRKVTNRRSVDRVHSWLLVGVVVLLPILKVLVIDRVNTPLRYDNLVLSSEEGVHLRNVDVPRHMIFNGQLHLLGHRALPHRYVPNWVSDQGLNVYLYWWDAVPGGPDYRVGLAIKDAQGLRWNDPAQYPPRWTREPPPSSQWPPDRYAQTAFALRPLPGTPPGIYTVTVSVFDAATSMTYPAIADPAGPAVETQDLASLSSSTEIVLGHVAIARPKAMPKMLDAHYQVQETASLGEVSNRTLPCGALHLTGYNLDREEAAPGDPLLVTLFWELETATAEDCIARLQLLDPSGERVRAFDLPPVRRDFPVSTWQAGDVWRGQHLLWLPADLESGRYDWVLQLCPKTSSRECVSANMAANPGSALPLKSLDIRAPERHWAGPAGSAPPLDLEANVRVGDVAVLLGAVLEPGISVHPGDVLQATLVWRAVAETRTSYRVFLHLLDSQDNVIAQSDGVPVEWTRPTTGWVSGEILKDPRLLHIPPGVSPGSYRLQAGMYTLEDGRLPTSEGGDTVVLGEIAITLSD